ncbi:SH3 domain-containing protein [Compostibacter hankyongensis]|uniref:SH3b domain-containing protein n=1 Tax=Compostibacter hankyongensis TaxID=1007089 RepID=A0ABP8G0D9_9BACT
MRTYLLILLLSAGTLTAAAQRPQQLFEQANGLYRQRQYDSAAQLYGRLIGEGYRNTALWYNAGNASYQAGRTGYAVYYFEKALQQDPGNAAVLHNLQLARQRVADRTDLPPTIIFVQWEQHILHLFSPNGWLLAGLLLCWLTIAGVALHFFRGSASRWVRWGTRLAAVLFVLALIGGILTYRQQMQHDTAIVMVSEAAVKSAPDNNSTDLQDIHEGYKVSILGNAPGWVKIRFGDEKEGWVAENTLKVL